MPEKTNTAQQNGIDNIRVENLRLKSALEQTIAGVLVTDSEGVIKFVNRNWSNTHGYNEDEILGKHVKMFVTDTDFNTKVIPFIEEVRECRTKVEELVHVKKDGTTIPVLVRLMCILDEKKQVTGFTWSAMDITIQKQKEKQLEERTYELEKLNKLMVNRELKMIELKREMDRLRKQLATKI